MQFPFPPPPPGYTEVLIARWMILVWAIVELGILIFRIRRWKQIRLREICSWFVALGLSLFVVPYGGCHYTNFDNNGWLTPLAIAVCSIPLIGIVVVVFRDYTVDPTRAKRIGTTLAIIFGCAGLYALIPSLGHPREISHRSQCKNNFKLIGLGLFNYESIF